MNGQKPFALRKKEIQGKDKIASDMRTKLQGVEERIETTENTGIHKRKSKTRKKLN